MVASAPALHAASGERLAALTMRRTTGSPDSTSTATEPVLLAPCESTAAKSMVWLPIWVAAGFQRNSPVRASKAAPTGSVPADNTAAGSAAETWKRSSLPGWANFRPGRRSGLEPSGVTESAASTTSDPTLADTTTPSPGLTALIWNSTVDWPPRVCTIAGTWTAGLELESLTSAALSPCTFRSVSRHFPGAPAGTVPGAQDNVPGALAIVKDVVELLPLNTAVNVAVPEADESAAALKLALVLPRRMVTVAGIVSPGLLVDKLTAKLPAAFETVTEQVVADTGATLEELQLTEEMVGVDHSVRLALLEEAPRAAVTVVVPFAPTFPMAAEKVAAEVPVVTVTLAGTVTAMEAELTLTTVLEAAFCDSCTVHEVVPPDITPFGLQLKPVTVAAVLRLMAIDWPEPL